MNPRNTTTVVSSTPSSSSCVSYASINERKNNVSSPSSSMLSVEPHQSSRQPHTCLETTKTIIHKTRQKYKTKSRIQRQAHQRQSYNVRMYQIPQFRLDKYKNSARERGKSFTLTDEQAITLFTSPCHYCGHNIQCNGIDRVDNSASYSSDNCVPCCSPCNRVKGSKRLDVFLRILDHYHIVYKPWPTPTATTNNALEAEEDVQQSSHCSSPSVISVIPDHDYIQTTCIAKQSPQTKRTRKLQRCRDNQKRYYNTTKGRLSHYKRNARSAQRAFTLTDEQAIALFTSPCHYCGYSALPECCNGIDRVDNSGPYSPDNSVSCCSICNRAKGAKHVDEFMGILKYYRISYASYNGSCKFQTHTGNDINNNNESPIDSKDT